MTSSVGSDKEYILRFDGGSRGNPGLAGSGAVLYVKDGNNLKEVWNGYFYLGESGITNNVAEYEGLVRGLRFVSKLPINFLRIEGDSELIIKQMKGIYRVKSEKLQELQREAQTLACKLSDKEFVHIPRAQNSRADELSNIAMDTRHSRHSDFNAAAFPVPAAKPTPEVVEDVVVTKKVELDELLEVSETKGKRKRKPSAKTKTKAPQTEKDLTNRHRVKLVPILHAQKASGEESLLIAETYKKVQQNDIVKYQRVFEFITIVYDTSEETEQYWSEINEGDHGKAKRTSKKYGEQLLYSFLDSSKLPGDLIPFDDESAPADNSDEDSNDFAYIFEQKGKPGKADSKDNSDPPVVLDSSPLKHAHITTMDYGNGNIRLMDPTLKAADVNFLTDDTYLVQLDWDAKKLSRQIDKINKLYNAVDTNQFDPHMSYVNTWRGHNFPESIMKLDLRRILLVPTSNLLKVLHGASKRGILVDATLYGWALGYEQCLAVQDFQQHKDDVSSSAPPVIAKTSKGTSSSSTKASAEKAKITNDNISSVVVPSEDLKEGLDEEKSAGLHAARPMDVELSSPPSPRKRSTKNKLLLVNDQDVMAQSSLAV